MFSVTIVSPISDKFPILVALRSDSVSDSKSKELNLESVKSYVDYFGAKDLVHSFQVNTANLVLFFKAIGVPLKPTNKILYILPRCEAVYNWAKDLGQNNLLSSLEKDPTLQVGFVDQAFFWTL